MFPASGHVDNVENFYFSLLSESERFMILVIGGNRESMQDFRSFVGIRSREHVEFEE